MADLRTLQADFMAQLLADGMPPSERWTSRQAAGLQVYRNNYRSSLVEALRATFPHTERWVGEGPFRRAAAHHLISHPPCSWTIDDAASGFDGTCGALFRHHPEVAELAWLELAMQSAFTARDAVPLGTAAFAQATAEFNAIAWTELRLTFMPGVAARPVDHDLPWIWRSTAAATGKPTPEATPEANPEATPESARAAATRRLVATRERRSAVVWREAEKPTFLMTDAAEGEAIAALMAGSSYGDVCLLLAGADPTEADAHAAAARAGAMLGRWLQRGLLSGLG